MSSVEKIRYTLISYINSLPYSFGIVIKWFILFCFKIFLTASVKLLTLYSLIISVFNKSFCLEEQTASSNDTSFTIRKINSKYIIERILEHGLTVFLLNRTFCLLVNDKREIALLLKELGSDRKIWIYVETEYGNYNHRLCTVPYFLLFPLLVITNNFILYTKYKSNSGRILYGEESGCELEIWQNSDVHYKNTENYQRTVYRIASNKWVAENNLLVENNNLEDKIRMLSNAEFPIDIVYTWVDSSDDKWRKSFNETIKKHGSTKPLGASANESRYRNLNELKYSLRSLSMYAGFFRKIFIVTAGQVPEWLNTENSRIEIIDHKEIFPGRGCLPTFNSHAIESRLHHIKGLGENYLYFNDDFFIGRSIGPDKFFLNDQTSYYFAAENTYIGLNNADSRDLPVDTAAKNNRDLINSKFDTIVNRKFVHAPYPQLKSILFDIENEFKEKLELTSRSRFRNKDDISLPSSLFHHYAKIKNRAVSGRINYRYIDLSSKNAVGNLKNLLRLNLRERPDVFCINDVDFEPESLESTSNYLQDFFESYFPLKSEFEK